MVILQINLVVVLCVGGIGSLRAPLPLADCTWHHSQPLFSTLERASEVVLLVAPGIGAIPLYAANWNDRYPVLLSNQKCECIGGSCQYPGIFSVGFHVWLCLTQPAGLCGTKNFSWIILVTGCDLPSVIQNSLYLWVRLAWIFFSINLSCCVKLLH